MLYGHRVSDAPSLFVALDRNSFGVVARSEVADGLRRLDVAVSETDFHECIQALEGDSNDRISLAEFVRWMGEDSPKARAAAAVGPGEGEGQGEAQQHAEVEGEAEGEAEQQTEEEEEETDPEEDHVAAQAAHLLAPPGCTPRAGSECTIECTLERSRDEASFERHAPHLPPAPLGGGEDGSEEEPSTGEVPVEAHALHLPPAPLGSGELTSEEGPQQPMYAEPSEPSEASAQEAGVGGASLGSAATEPPARPPTPMSRGHAVLLSAVPGVWHRLASKKAVANEDWAGHRFEELMQGKPGSRVPREALANKALDDTIRDCLGDVLPNEEILRPLVNLAFSRADADEDDCLSREEFVAFTWCLKRLAADADLEVEMTLVSDQALPDLASLGGPVEAWRDVIAKAREQHRLWADTAFGILDLKGQGMLTLEDIHRPAFQHLLQQLPYKHLAEHSTLVPCLGFALWKAGLTAEGSTTRAISRSQFASLSWQLVRMDLDVDREAERLTDSVAVYTGADGLAAAD